MLWNLILGVVGTGKMDVYLGPQLPKERDAVGLFPRVSFRSCLQAKVKHEAGGEERFLYWWLTFRF